MFVLLLSRSNFAEIPAAVSTILTVPIFATASASLTTWVAVKLIGLLSEAVMLPILRTLVFKASILLAMFAAVSRILTVPNLSTTAEAAESWAADKATVPVDVVMLAMWVMLLFKALRLVVILAAVSVTATPLILATASALAVTWDARKPIVPLEAVIESTLALLLRALILVTIFAAVSDTLTVPNLATTAAWAESWAVVKETVPSETVSVSILARLLLIALMFETMFCAVSLTVISAAVPSFARTAVSVVTWLAVRVTVPLAVIPEIESILLFKLSISLVICSAVSLIVTLPNLATTAASAVNCALVKTKGMPSEAVMLPMWSILVFKAPIAWTILSAVSLTFTVPNLATTAASATICAAFKLTVPPVAVMLAIWAILLLNAVMLEAILAALSLTTTSESLATTAASAATWEADKVIVPLEEVMLLT